MMIGVPRWVADLGFLPSCHEQVRRNECHHGRKPEPEPLRAVYHHAIDHSLVEFSAGDPHQGNHDDSQHPEDHLHFGV